MSCANSQNEYTGDGLETGYLFTFEYEQQAEVQVEVYNPDTVDWEVKQQDDATYGWAFNGLAAITFNTAPADGVKFKIARNTIINPMQATFYPGSSIRAQDLNNNFEQLQRGLEDSNCNQETLKEYVDENFLKFNGTDANVTKLPEQLAGTVPDDDKYVMSNAVSIERYDVLVGTTPSNPTPSQEGKYWIDTTQERISYWNSDIGAWVDTSQTGPEGPQGPPGEGVTYQGTVDATQPDSAPDTVDIGDFYYNTGTGIGDGSWGPSVAGTALSPGHRLIRNAGGTWDVISPTPTSDELWTQVVGALRPTDTNNDLEIPGVIETGTGIRFGDGTTQTTAAVSTVALWERNGVELSPVTAGDDIRLGDPAATNILIDENSGYTHECLNGGIEIIHRTNGTAFYATAEGNLAISSNFECEGVISGTESTGTPNFGDGSNFYVVDGGVVNNPLNAQTGIAGLFRVIQAPTGWGDQYSTPPTITTVPCIVPFYVESVGQVRLGQAIGVA